LVREKINRLDRRGAAPESRRPAILLAPPDSPPGLPYPQPRHEAIRFQAEVMEPEADFDETGFELAPVPPSPADQSGQQELFCDDCSQPAEADRDPVLWSAGSGQTFPAVDFVQADAPE